MLSRQSFLKHVQYKRVNIPKTHNKTWVDRGGYCMGLVIIFTLVTLLAVFATLRTLREKTFRERLCNCNCTRFRMVYNHDCSI